MDSYPQKQPESQGHYSDKIPMLYSAAILRSVWANIHALLQIDNSNLYAEEILLPHSN